VRTGGLTGDTADVRWELDAHHRSRSRNTDTPSLDPSGIEFHRARSARRHPHRQEEQEPMTKSEASHDHLMTRVTTQTAAGETAC
jgi:hypothetical protein